MSLVDGICDDAPIGEDDHNELVDDEGRLYPVATGPDALVECGRLRRDLHSEGLDSNHYFPEQDWHSFIEQVA